MCHMFTDSIDELHIMADKLHLKRSWFQDKSIAHYDICLSVRDKAKRFGAIEIDLIKFIREKMKYE